MSTANTSLKKERAHLDFVQLGFLPLLHKSVEERAAREVGQRLICSVPGERRFAHENPLSLTLSPLARGEGTENRGGLNGAASRGNN
jgi:hypothetical protein